MVGPNLQSGSLEWFASEQSRVVRWIGVFEELAYDCAFVEGFSFVGEGGDETAGIEFEEG